MRLVKNLSPNLAFSVPAGRQDTEEYSKPYGYEKWNDRIEL